jgi:uncharacterized protein
MNSEIMVGQRSFINLRLNNLLLVLVLLIFTLCPAAALDVPKLQGRVNDLAGLISRGTEAELESRMAELESSDSTQLVILTITSLEGEVLEEYSIRVAEEWGIGQKGYDNGALLLVSKNDRSVRLEVGYGLEGSLTDLLAGRIIDNEILPNFSAGRFDAGFLKGVEAVTAAVKGEYKAEAKASSRVGSVRSGRSLMPFFIIFIVVAMIGSKKRIFGGLAGAVLVPVIGVFVLSLGLQMLFFLIPLGFIGGLVLPGFYFLPGIGMGRRSHYHGGGGFSSFGGGGFSGGGGGFGGGGASGGW